MKRVFPVECFGWVSHGREESRAQVSWVSISQLGHVQGCEKVLARRHDSGLRPPQRQPAAATHCFKISGGKPPDPQSPANLNESSLKAGLPLALSFCLALFSLPSSCIHLVRVCEGRHGMAEAWCMTWQQHQHEMDLTKKLKARNERTKQCSIKL